MSSEAKASKPYVRQATRDDAIRLAPRLREDDLKEIAHGSDLTAEQALLYSLKVSNEAYAVISGDTVVALFGVSGVPGVIGSPWMLASDGLSGIRKTFLRECRMWVAGMLTVYHSLENRVWVGNALHIQWLKWLGFHFDPAAPHGIDDEPFYRFHMKEEYV